MTLSIIAAIASNNALGYKNQLIYSIKEDMKRFKNLTTGHTIIMGRNTYDSLPKGALPNRRNIVLSNSIKELPGCDVYLSIDDALASCKDDEEVFIIGGASLYKVTIDMCDKLYLTEIYDEPENADVFFPEIPDSFDVSYAEVHTDEKSGLTYSFTDYQKGKKHGFPNIEDMKPLEQEFVKIIDEHFNELLS